MNAGILTSGYAAPTMPNRLLGSPTAVRVPISFRQEWHPDVLSWTRRASNNGGRFSYPTLLALQAFCESIAAAGLRSRMLRLNLMCGDNLNAALVPLYVAGSTDGDRLGNATDTNSNFVSADYSETAGLIGNGSNKALDTGFSMAAAGITLTGHMSAYHAAWTPAAGKALMGVVSSNFGQVYLLQTNETNSAIYENYWGGTTAIAGSTQSTPTHLLIQRTASTSATVYANGASLIASSSSVAGGDPGRSIFIFARNQGAIANPSNIRCRGYSIGLTMTPAQISTFYSLMAAFATALRRVPA